jgi:hypothetical protein
MRLPPELRTSIYEYALAKSRTINLHHQTDYGLCTGPGLLRVSKQLRREALPIYFKVNAFSIHVLLAHLDKLASWLEVSAKLCGSKVFGGLQFQVQWCPWSDLPRAKGLVQLLAADVLELDLSRIDTRLPIRMAGASQLGCLFVMNDLQGGMYVQRALEEAVLIGAAAREQKWSLSRVSQQFDVLMALKMPLKHLKAYNQIKKVRTRKVEKMERRNERRGLEQ